MNETGCMSHVLIFECLSPEDVNMLVQESMIEHLDPIPGNTLLQSPDARKSGLFFVKEGKVRLFKLNADGKAFTLDILGSGGMFGELASVSLGTGDLFIETIEDTSLCVMTNERLERLLIERPKVAVRFLRELGRLLKEREELLTSLVFGDMTEQVLHVLIKLSRQFGVREDGFHRIGLKLTHQEIANMIGIRRETVTGILKKLTKDGIVRTRRQSILVHMDRAKGKIGRTLMDASVRRA